MGTITPVPNPKDISRFAWLEPWLARGAQPAPQGYRWLDEQGFKVVVNLRTHDEAHSIEKCAHELVPVHIPVVNNRAPSEAQALEWLDLCASQYMRPLYIHCNLGEGRTSMFCALVRLAQGWPLEEAIVEQQPFGFDPEGEHHEQARFLQTFVRKGLAETVWIF
jgi:protein tyrosine/serine phosphatase